MAGIVVLVWAVWVVFFCDGRDCCCSVVLAVADWSLVGFLFCVVGEAFLDGWVFEDWGLGIREIATA